MGGKEKRNIKNRPICEKHGVLMHMNGNYKGTIRWRCPTCTRDNIGKRRKKAVVKPVVEQEPVAFLDQVWDRDKPFVFSKKNEQVYRGLTEKERIIIMSAAMDLVDANEEERDISHE